MESYRAVQLTGISSELCIVSGYRGAGKTCLVREALNKMVQEGALTAYAKFDQFNEDVSFTAMVIFLGYAADGRYNASATLQNKYSSRAPKI
jgi:predicted ATPase